MSKFGDKARSAIKTINTPVPAKRRQVRRQTWHDGVHKDPLKTSEVKNAACYEAGCQLPLTEKMSVLR